MGKDTKISWTNLTASPWFGCTEVDACCVNCYSRELTKQKFGFVNFERGVFGIMRNAYRKAGFKDWATRPVWGDKATRVKSKGFWKDVHKWNREAGQAELSRCRELSDTNDEPYERPRIFTSLIDWLDEMPGGIIDLEGNRLDPVQVLAEFLQVIRACDALDWLLLTKRPENFSKLLHAAMRKIHDGTDDWISGWLDGEAPGHVWFGWTAGTFKQWQERHALSWDIPARIHWVSAEPLLEHLCFSSILRDEEASTSHNIDWIVIGGESGAKRRQCDLELITMLATSAKNCGVRVYVKQDAGLLPGQKGRIPDDIWNLKEFPR